MGRMLLTSNNVYYFKKESMKNQLGWGDCRVRLLSPNELYFIEALGLNYGFVIEGPCVFKGD